VARPGPPTSDGEPGPTIRNKVEVAFLLTLYAFPEKLGIRPKTGFLADNFGHRCASKSIKGSIDADFHLGFNKILSQKNGSMGWGPGPAKDGQNIQNMSSL